MMEPVIIGPCTLFLANCLDVLPTLQGIDAVVTDPPYGIDYQSAWRTDKATWKPKLKGDEKPAVEFIPLVTAPAMLCFCRWDTEHDFSEAMTDSGWEVKSQVIWDRMSHGMGDLNGAFAPQHDNALFATRGDFKWWEDRPQDVIRVARVPSEQMVHPTEKPVPLMSILVKYLVPPLATILDPYMGSGTTGIACIRTGRRFVGVEIDENYFRIACERITRELQQQRLLL